MRSPKFAAHEFHWKERHVKEEVQFSFGKTVISVTILYQDRKRLSITVNPDKTVIVKAPVDRSHEEVVLHLRKRGPWIIRQLDYFDQFHPLPVERQYVSGETHYYLGRQYRLRIREGKKPQVKLVGRFFLLGIPDPADSEKAKQLMLKWYSQHARALFQRRIDMYLQRFLQLGGRMPEIRFRRMKKRWGSCSPNGVLLLNTELVKAPIHCIDYVIIHELCHLVHPHHDKDFYRLLRRILPDWQKRKERLEKVLL